MLLWLMATCVGIVVYSVGVILLSDTSREHIRSRVDNLAQNANMDDIHAEVMNQKRLDRKKKKNGLISKAFADSLEMSGITISAQEFLTFWACTTFGPIILGVLFSMHSIAVLGLGIIGFAVPPFIVQHSKNKREQLFNKQLSDALTIMGNCMRSGYSFQQAMESVAQEMQPPISTEFSKVIKEINYGASMETALNNMIARVNNKDMELLVAAVLTSVQVGANLSDLLDIIAGTVSDRIRLREEVRVMTAQGRLSGLIIGLLPVAIILMLMVINPSYFLDFAKTGIGQMLLLLSVVMEITGFVVINKIVDIDY